MEYVIPIKCDAKKNSICKSSNKLFQKNKLQDNNWVGHPVTKPVDDVASQKRKAIIEGDNDQNENLEMDIIYEGALDKALIVHGKTLKERHPGGGIMRSLTMDTWIKKCLSFQKSFY